MRYLSYSVLIYLVFFSAEAICQAGQSAEELIKTLEPADNLSAASNELFVLIPSNLNLTDIFDASSDYSLFKLNTDVLLEGGNIRIKRNAQTEANPLIPEPRALEAEDRAPRKINLFRNILNTKKRSPPLYLVNGTVCRFLSTGPVCTTISTNGLPGK